MRHCLPFAIVGATTAFVLHAGTVFAGESKLQNEPNEAAKKNDLQQLEWLVGEWIHERTEDGKKVRIRLSCHWTLDKRFIAADSVRYRDGRAISKMHSMIGWDPEHKRITSWAFYAHGSHRISTWDGMGDKWKATGRLVMPDGSKVTATVLHLHPDKNTYVIRMTQHTNKGKTTVVDKAVSYHRVGKKK